ncbi:MAG TPA: malonyl-ACP O-methyltransferase BioC [Gammaproteobacteria bacterium]|nr:malonyl-ACP O-methyltransferase BioC [Gammaproteobacteria bacterium]
MSEPGHDRDRAALDTAQVRRAFERASVDYDRAAVLQKAVREELLERLDLARIAPKRVLDAGAGTGRGSAALARRFPRARIVALDLAVGMLRKARRNRPWRAKIALVCGDLTRLPLASASIDLAFCSLALQWCDPPARALGELRRVLAPRSLLTFASFGPDTLKELRAAWAEVDDLPHVNRFMDMHDLGDSLVQAGFADPVLDVDYATLTYGDVFALMRDLKAIGAHNAAQGRARGLTGKRKLAAFAAAYERRRDSGRLPATYEIVYGSAWTPEAPAGVRADAGEARIPPGMIGRRRR